MASANASDVHDIVSCDQAPIGPVRKLDREQVDRETKRDIDAPRERERERGLTGMLASSLSSLAGAARERQGPLVIVAVLLLGGGSGVGSTWLLGPGAAADDALRQQIAELGRVADAQQKSLEAQRASSEAQQQALDRLDARVDKCDASVRELEDDARAMQLWTASALPQLAGGIEQLAEHVGARVRITLPEMPGRPRR